MAFLMIKLYAPRLTGDSATIFGVSGGYPSLVRVGPGRSPSYKACVIYLKKGLYLGVATGASCGWLGRFGALGK